ncbi:MAG: 30S ribosomal protein S4 [Bdellovibrionales bacterium]
MSRVIESVCKLCRREHAKLFLKGSRCFTDKCSFERRAYPPGQHGQSRTKFSEYALQLREKQKVRRYYGIFEKQFRKMFKIADGKKGETGYNLLADLELRFDNVVYTAGFAASRRQAKQLISHKHFMVNGKKNNIPSMSLKPGDVIEVIEASKEATPILAGLELSNTREVPTWVEVTDKKATIKDRPSREQISLAVEENMIVEYYSR